MMRSSLIQILFLGSLSFISGCASGPVTTEINPNKNPVSSAPSQFQSSIQSIEQFGDNFPSGTDSLEVKTLHSSALNALITEQRRIETELRLTSKLQLKPGRSYEFDLESFCVNAGIERPVKGDGLFLGDIKGRAKSWLPEILKRYHKARITQNDAQVLIWSLLSGSRFDELSQENQSNLLKIFPDAPARFGNSILEESASSFLASQIPSEIVSAEEKIDDYRSLLQNAQKTYSEIERTLSPQSSRQSPLPVGWLRHEDGYFIRLKADGYRQVHVQIYAPENLKAGTAFNPTEQIALPGEGQRLALSSNVISSVRDDLGRRFKSSTGKSPSEVAFCIKHPLDAFKIYKFAQKSLRLTWDNFDSPHAFQDDKSDAFGHFVWSSMITNEIGSERAREFLEAHEDFPDNEPKSKAMDLFNNEKGIAFGTSNPSAAASFEKRAIQEGLAKIKNKELKWLK